MKSCLRRLREPNKKIQNDSKVSILKFSLALENRIMCDSSILSKLKLCFAMKDEIKF